MEAEKLCWIKTIHETDAGGELKSAYQAVQSPHGTVDNVYRAQSLHPQSILGHDRLYKAVLHHPEARLPRWFLETIAVYTSLLNDCPYAVSHHYANLLSLLPQGRQGKNLLEALNTGDLSPVFTSKEIALLEYTKKLTCSPSKMKEADIDVLRQAGIDDGEILEVNQVCACFNYSNRVLNGLGVALGDDIVGYYPESQNESSP